MRIRHLLWIVPLLFIAVLIAAIGFMVSTQTGLHWLIAMADRFAPGDIAYERLEGRLIGPLSLDNLRYQDETTAVKIAHADFDWEPSALLSATARIHRFNADGIEVHLAETPPPEEPPEPFTLQDIRLPLWVDVKDVDITAIRIYTAGAEQPVVIDQIVLAARTRNQTVELDTLAIRMPQGRLSLNGQLEPVGAYPMHLNLQWDFAIPEIGPLAGQGTVYGDLAELYITHTVSGAVIAELNAHVREILDTPLWSAQLTLTAPDLGMVNPELQGSTLAATVQTQGSLDNFEASGDLTTTLPEVGPMDAAFRVRGSSEALRIDELTLRGREAPLLIALQGDLELDEWRFDATGRWQALTWPLTDPPQVESPHGEFTLQGTPQDYRLRLETALRGNDFGQLNARLSAAGTDQAIEVSELALRSPDDRLALNAEGRLTFADLSFSASGEWQSLVWPLVNQAQVTSPGGTFQASGRLQDYRFALDAQLQGPDIPTGHWRLEGQGSADALEQATLQGQVLEGKVQGHFSARWQPQLSWQAQLSARDINPGAHWQQLSGKLAVALKSEGRLIAEGLDATLQLDELSGTLNEQTVRGRGRVAVRDEDLAIDDLYIQAGGARLQASGTLEQRWAIRWQVEAPDLRQLMPDASGNINATGNISGPRDQPQVSVDLRGDGLAYNETRIDRVRGDAHIDLSGASRSRLNLAAVEMQLAGQSWQQLTVTGDGIPESHNLQASLSGDLGRFNLTLDAGLRDEAWQGRLTRLSAAGDAFGSWNLQAPATLQAAADQASIGQTCLSSPPARVCIQGEWDQQAGASGQLSLTQLPLARFQGLLPAEVEIDTHLSGEARGISRPDGTVQGTIDMALTPGTLRLTAITAMPPLEIPLREAILRAKAAEGDASAQIGVDMDTFGRLAATVELEEFQHDPQLAGRIQAEVNDLGMIPALVPQLMNTTGRVVADIALGGTPTAPQIGGELRLQEAATDIPEVGVRIQDIQLTAVSTEWGPLQISGFARSGPGELRLSGQVEPTTAQVELNIRGENFAAVGTPEIQALISPQLNLNVEQGRVNLSGQITVPQAFLTPPDIVTAGVTASPDVVIVSEPEPEDEATEPVRALDIFIRVRIILGDDVNVEAAGFRGAIRGNLLVEQTPQLPARGTGTVEVETGLYQIYGQELEIERGRILYVGSPLDNPGLDLRVIRTVGEITAGVRVRGTLNEPDLELFSTPTMPDTTILSYLAFGRSPDVRSTAEGELLLRAASALGLRGGDLVTEHLRETFGLDELRFEAADDDITDVALVIGRYLTPDLYVSYGVGIFDAINTFTLRYDITDRLKFQSTTNDHTGADLIYTIER